MTDLDYCHSANSDIAELGAPATMQNCDVIGTVTIINVFFRGLCFGA
jgi:hypothetical protein